MVHPKTWAREIRRKGIHALAILFIIPIALLPKVWAIRVIGIAVIIALFIHWYHSKRQLRGKYFENMVASLKISEPEKLKMLKNGQFLRRFEEDVIFGFIKDIRRKREREPLLATFYLLLSTFLALVLLGVPYAIFGLLAISFGDAAATLVGKLAGKHRISYNQEKSIEGWIGFFVATSLSIFIFLTIMPEYAIFSPLAIALIAGTIGAFIETIPTVNDNTIIPLGVGFIIWLSALLL